MRNLFKSTCAGLLTDELSARRDELEKIRDSPRVLNAPDGDISLNFGKTPLDDNIKIRRVFLSKSQQFCGEGRDKKEKIEGDSSESLICKSARLSGRVFPSPNGIIFKFRNGPFLGVALC